MTERFLYKVKTDEEAALIKSGRVEVTADGSVVIFYNRTDNLPVRLKHTKEELQEALGEMYNEDNLIKWRVEDEHTSNN